MYPLFVNKGLKSRNNLIAFKKELINLVKTIF